MMTKRTVNQLAYEIVGCAIEVHKTLGPGLLESVYEQCLCHELLLRGYKVQRQVSIPVNYKGTILNTLLRLDLLVNDCVIVELKAVTEIHPVYEAQILSHMKLLQKPKGLLINFFTTNITQSVKPFVNEYFTKLQS